MKLYRPFSNVDREMIKALFTDASALNLLVCTISTQYIQTIPGRYCHMNMYQNLSIYFLLQVPVLCTPKINLLQNRRFSKDTSTFVFLTIYQSVFLFKKEMEIGR